MHFLPRCASLVLAILTFAACERKTVVVIEQPATPAPEPIARTTTAETIRLATAVDAFEREATSANAAAVNTALAKLDGEIAELQQRVATGNGHAREEAAAKLRNLQEYRAAELARFAAAQLRTNAGAEKVENPARGTGDKLENEARKAGDAVEDAARKTGNALEDLVR